MKQCCQTPPFISYTNLKLEKLILKYIDFVRLCECVELLKDMEMKGLLDMTKVHASLWLFPATVLQF